MAHAIASLTGTLKHSIFGRPVVGPCAICRDMGGREAYVHGRNVVLCSDCETHADEVEVHFFADRARRRVE